jgi:branched-chain amino acid transport system substrate-binding protein
MKKRFKRSGVGGLLLAVFLFGFEALPPAAVSQEPIKIAVISPLAGIIGPIGQSHLKGAKVAEMHINEDGGILGRKISILERDTAASPATAVKVVREAAMNEKVKIFTGVASSAVALAVSPLMEQLDSLLIIAAAQTHKVTGKNCNPHVFRICVNSTSVVRSVAKLAVDNYPKVTRWAGINPDYEYGHDCWGGFKKALTQLNPKISIVEEQWPKFMATNFEPQILKVLQAKPEGLYSTLYSGDFVTFVKQAKKYKFFENIKVFINHSVETDVAIPLGPDMVDLWGGGHYYYAAYDNPLNKRFVEGYKKLHGGALPYYASSETYSALYALKAAAEKMKSLETKDLIKGLRGLKFDSVTGKREISAWNHQTARNHIYVHFVPTPEAPGWKVADIKTPWSAPFDPKPDEAEFACKMKW